MVHRENGGNMVYATKEATTHQRVERWDATADDIQKKLVKLLAPANGYRVIDHLQILPVDAYSKNHLCFVIWHAESQPDAQEEDNKHG
jgi:hypothetical protein